jgi:lipoate-protein ligase A
MHDVAWNFCITGENTGAFNMWFDEMLVRRLFDGLGLPTLRVYKWKPWAISIGQHQRLSDINLNRCKEDGIDVVRRPTGGRAILHAEELTYSVVMRTEHKGIHQVYREIGDALVEGLKVFGVEVSLQRSQPDFSQMYKTPSAIPCFSSSARYEIEWNGRKLVGSAQRRYASGSGDVVLQHGSILCGTAHHRLSDYLQLEDQLFSHEVQTDLKEKTTDLGEISGHPVNFKLLSGCIKKGFERMWGVTFTDLDLMTSARNETYG